MTDWDADEYMKAVLKDVEKVTPTPKGKSRAQRKTEAPPPSRIKATPYIYRDPTTIPPRERLYGNHIVRKFCSATLLASGVGKTLLLILEQIAMGLNRPLLGIQPRQRCRTWYWNGEDPRDEIERQIAAACLHYKIDPRELEDGWFYFNSGRDTEIIIASETNNGTKIADPVVDALIAEIRDKKIDVLRIDPFVSCHRVTENDNNAIDAVAKKWNEIADATNIAIELSHHTRKTYGIEITVEDGRGASALLAAVRVARTLNPMSEKEAEEVGITVRRRYFRVENGKTNLSAPPERADWYHIASVELGNGNAVREGDSIGVVTQWHWPDLMAGMTAADFDKVAAVIKSDHWRKDVQAKQWVGHAVATALELNITNKQDRAKIRTAIETWLKSKTLVVVKGEDEKRMMREFVVVGEGQAEA